MRAYGYWTYRGLIVCLFYRALKLFNDNRIGYGVFLELCHEIDDIDNLNRKIFRIKAGWY